MKSALLTGENGTIARCAQFIRFVNQKVEGVRGKWLEIAAFALYVIAHLLISMVHEPWYDEAVAWNIAKCASIKEILFEIPHYEGHPPLWHLILVPFAKLGAPYELSLSIVSLIFAGAACALIIWKAPFPRIIRILLPFTYFFFFQYGVISRPYCVMMLVFVLLAMVYHKRNEQPWKYTILLMSLCLTSAYGIVIAGGLAAVWVFEIWNLQKLNVFIKSMCKDKRILCLISLLVFAVLLILEIMPHADAYAIDRNVSRTNSLLLCLSYMLLALPIEVSVSSIYTAGTYLTTAEFFLPVLISTCALGVVFWFFAILWGNRKKTTWLLIVPYVLFSVFAALVYMYTHHIGIGLLFFVFWFWVSCEAKSNVSIVERFSVPTGILMKNILTVFCGAALIVSLYWNISSCAQDVVDVYAAGRNEAAFIKENGLENYRIMANWSVTVDKDGNVIKMDTNACPSADNIAPYFDHNLFFNFNDGRDDLNYSTHKVSSDEEDNAKFEEWKQALPDVCYMMSKNSSYDAKFPIELVYEDLDFLEEYSLVYVNTNNMVWKGVERPKRSVIYVKKELAEELGLTVLDIYGNPKN